MSRPSYSKEKRAAFSIFMKNRLNKMGLKSAEAAQLIDAKANTFQGWTRGTSIPGIEDLKKICELFDENYIVVACIFSYPDYRRPDYWLGPDYKKDSRYGSLYNECIVAAPKEEPRKEKKQRKTPETYAALHACCKRLEDNETTVVTTDESNLTAAEAVEVLEHNGGLLDVINGVLSETGVSVNDSYDGRLVSGFNMNGVQIVVDLTAEEIADYIYSAVRKKAKMAIAAFSED